MSNGYCIEGGAKVVHVVHWWCFFWSSEKRSKLEGLASGGASGAFLVFSTFFIYIIHLGVSGAFFPKNYAHARTRSDEHSFSA